MGMTPKFLKQDTLSKITSFLKSKKQDAEVIKKLEILIIASKKGIKATADFYEISRHTITNWAKCADSEQFDQLAYSREPKRPTMFNYKIRSVMHEWIKNDPNLTINIIKMRLEEQCSITPSKSTVHREMRKLKLAYIKPRPKHYKQSAEKVESFKKKYK